MRIPARIAEHPIESVVAAVLLLAVLLGSAESGGNSQASGRAQAGVPAAQRVATEQM